MSLVAYYNLHSYIWGSWKILLCHVYVVSLRMQIGTLFCFLLFMHMWCPCVHLVNCSSAMDSLKVIYVPKSQEYTWVSSPKVFMTDFFFLKYDSFFLILCYLHMQSACILHYSLHKLFQFTCFKLLVQAFSYFFVE